MELKPYKDLIALSKEKLDETMAGPRAKRQKKKAEFEMAKIEEDIAEKEAAIEEMVLEKDIDFKKLIDSLDEIALLEDRKDQYAKVLKQLFPTKKK